MSSSSCVAFDFSEELRCGICLDSWRSPSEIEPCGHIFCDGCCRGLTHCPVCRVCITSLTKPNRTIINMAAAVKVRCQQCQWVGTREASATHQCGTTTGPSLSKVQPASSMGNGSPFVPQPYGTYGRPPLPFPGAAPQQPLTGYSIPPPSGGVQHFAVPVPALQQQQSSGSYYLQPQPGEPVATTQLSSSGYSNQQHPGALQLQYSSGFSGQPFPMAPGQPQPPLGPYPGGYNMTPQRPPQRYSVIQPTGPRPWEAYRLSQEEYDQIMSLFFTFDETESGTLDRRELGRLARCLNFVRSPSEVDAIFRDMDSDGNGTLSMAEFCTWLTYNKPDPSALYGLTQSEYNTVMMQFFTYDTDQDGLLDVAQFERLVRSLGFSGTSAQAAQLFQCIDKDFNGHVDLHEFLSYQAVRKARGLGVLSTRKRT